MTTNPDGPVRDDRRPPFCYQTHDALEALRDKFSGARRSTALGVYLTLTEVANRKGGSDARGVGFVASRKELAGLAGVSRDTLDRYVAALEEAGLLIVERRREDAVNLPSVWVLTEPTGASGAPPGRTHAATPGRTGAADTRAGRVKDLRNQDIETSSLRSDVPRLRKNEGRDLAMDTLAEACDVDVAGGRAGETATALNGRRGEKGIRELYWLECVRAADEHGLTEQLAEVREHFEEILANRIRHKAKLYRAKMPGAFMTPGALRKYWLDLERMPSPAGSPLSGADIEAIAAERGM